MAQAVIDGTGTPLIVRRKLKPTHVERTQFGDGDNSDITVVDSPGGRVGALNCWEHLQSLTKYAMYAQGEQLHFADTETKKQLLNLGGGHARIYGPDGRDLATPLPPTEEGILYADNDYGMILAAKNAADPVGHYSRPDVFTLHMQSGGRLPKLSESKPVVTVAPEEEGEEAVSSFG